MNPNSLVPLKFIKDHKGGTSSRVGDVTVYPHWDYKQMVNPGDVWFCILDTYSSPTAYFAIPERRFEDADFEKLIEEHMEEIAPIVWNLYQDSVMVSLDDFISEKHQSEIIGLKEEIALLKGEIERMNQVNCSGDCTVLKTVCKVTRIDSNKIKSDMFGPSVKVRLSPNLRRMTVTNDPEGGYEVVDGVLDIPGLDALLDYESECDMIATMNDGSISITLYDSVTGSAPSIDA